MLAIGIDIGGSRTRAVIVTERGDILGWQEIATSAFDCVEQLLAWIGSAVIAFRAEAASQSKLISYIGLAVPGVLDRECGAVCRAVNIPWIESHPIRSQLEDVTNLAVMLTSDADAATWGEYVTLQPRPERFVHLRLGTGVALGAVVNGTLQQFPRAPTGGWHLDVLVVDETRDARLCSCGRRGCLEAYIGRVALRRRMTELGMTGGVDELPRLIDEGHAAAIGIVDAAALRLMSAITRIRAELAPELIVVGGGVVAAVPAVLAVCQQRNARQVDSPHEILRTSMLGDGAGAIGAATLARAPSTPNSRSR